MLVEPTETCYRVVALRDVTPSIREVSADPAGTPLPHVAGQYALVSDAEQTLPPRSFSLAGAPRPDGRITLLVTRYPGGAFSGWVHQSMRPGDQLLLDGPYGTLCAPPAVPLLLVSAGSGFAPMRALAEQSLAADPAADIAVAISARKAADVIDPDRLAHLTATHPHFRYLRALTREPGAGTGQLPGRLAELVPDLLRRHVFIAGPDGFVRSCAAAARSAGVPAAALHTEEFYAEPTPWRRPEKLGA